jgi:hypothetical protein
MILKLFIPYLQVEYYFRIEFLWQEIGTSKVDMVFAKKINMSRKIRSKVLD